MKQFIAIAVIAVIMLTTACASAEGGLSFSAMRTNTRYLINAQRIASSTLSAHIVQNGPNTIAINLAEVSGNNSFSAFFR